MNEILIPISNKEFKEKVTIRFNSINDGFNNYNNKTIEGTEVAFISFLQEAFELNGAENSYVDFYYNVLNDEDKKKLKELINDEDKILLEEFEKNYHEKNIYFKQTDNITLTQPLEVGNVVSFYGVYDGDGYYIANLNATDTSSRGEVTLFHYLYGTVRNLGLKDVNFTSKFCASTIANYL